MIGSYLPLLVTLIFLAAILQDDFAFTLLYLFAGTFALATWWSHRSLAAIHYTRDFAQRAFLGERILVRLEIKNSSLLPIPWLRIHEGLPVELSGPDSFQRVATMGPGALKVYEYSIEARRRGYYTIGPVFFISSDILGLGASDLRREGQADYLTVYPKIIRLTNISFPSMSPIGTLRHYQPVFEDPTRVMGKRDYVVGDSLRRIDWKSTATIGQMRVKMFEPSIALETVIFLNLNASDYYYRARIASSELAVIIAASIANWVVEKKQAVGLCAHGGDLLTGEHEKQFIPARSGREHLMRILDVLARIKMEEKTGFAASIRNQRVNFPWGTTLIIITGDVDDYLLNEAYQARRAGLNISIILSGTVVNARDIYFKAGYYGVPVINISTEEDMDIWRV